MYPIGALTARRAYRAHAPAGRSHLVGRPAPAADGLKPGLVKEEKPRSSESLEACGSGAGTAAWQGAHQSRAGCMHCLRGQAAWSTIKRSNGAFAQDMPQHALHRTLSAADVAATALAARPDSTYGRAGDMARWAAPLPGELALTLESASCSCLFSSSACLSLDLKAEICSSMYVCSLFCAV